MDDLSSRYPSACSNPPSLSSQKTKVIVNVYDLLPPGKLSTVLWALGSSLLHTGVVIGDREYAYGGHDRPGISGVYWTHPKTEPPGGRFRCELLHGFTFLTDSEIEEVIRNTAQKFQGTRYNLLTNNCNHFTSYLCEELTGTASPAWMNRAASVGIALPCVVPPEWVAAPDYDDADGAPVDPDNGLDEESAMLRSSDRRAAP